MLLQAALSLDVLLLQLSDKVVLQLHLLQALVVLSVSLRGFDSVLLLVLFQLVNVLLQLLGLCLVPLDLVLQLLELPLQRLDGVALLALLVLSEDHVLVEDVTLAHLRLDALFILGDPPTEVFILLINEEQLGFYSAQVGFQLVLEDFKGGVFFLSLVEKGFLSPQLMLELLDLKLLLHLLLLLLLKCSDLLLVFLDLLLVVLREALLLVLIMSFFDLLLLKAPVDTL